MSVTYVDKSAFIKKRNGVDVHIGDKTSRENDIYCIAGYHDDDLIAFSETHKNGFSLNGADNCGLKVHISTDFLEYNRLEKHFCFLRDSDRIMKLWD